MAAIAVANALAPATVPVCSLVMVADAISISNIEG